MSYPDSPGQYSAPEANSGGFPQPPPPPRPGQHYPQFSAYPGAFGPAAVRGPAGRAAIASAVLAIEGAVFALVLMFFDFDLMKLLRLTDYAWVSWLLLAVCLIELCTLLPGGILVLARRTAGRWLIVVGCLVHLVLGILSLVSASSVHGRASGLELRTSSGLTTIDLLAALLPAILTMIFVLLPVTTAWLTWRDPSPIYGQPPFHGGPQVPYGQAPYGPPPGQFPPPPS
jgi:hypothetical protein